MTYLMQSSRVLLASAALALSSLALAGEPAMTENGMLVDHKSMTLYTFEKDADGKSNCNDKCAVNWPPLMATSADKAMGDWSLVKRTDGSQQWAYKGKPLYTFVMDKQAGDITGAGKMDGAWSVAKP